MPYSIIVILTVFISLSCNKDAVDDKGVETPKKLKVAFYNVENLFDTLDDANKFDEDFLPSSTKQWNKVRYDDKITKISKVITHLNADAVGLCEIENTNVLNDLVKAVEGNWRYVHFESDDSRGIDVALLYNADKLNVTKQAVYKITLTDEPGYKTRDILYVQAANEQDSFNFIVAHYHSRLTGIEESKHYRIAASKKIREVIEGFSLSQPTLVLGDFNANPKDEPIKQYLVVNSSQPAKLPVLANPAEQVNIVNEGSTQYSGDWQLYDQVLYYTPAKYTFKQFSIVKPEWITEQSGFYKGFPYRTYAGDNYLGGYSDHFPVYIEFRY